MYRIAIDLGGTKIEGMITRENPLDIIERKRIPTERDKGYDNIIGKIAGLIAEMKRAAPAPGEFIIGLGMPGSPHPQTGVIRNANTTALNGREFTKDLQQAVGQHVTIANDANCLTLSESLLGAAKGFQSVCGIIMGTGMGGGIFKDGKIIEGANGNGGEWGHSTVEPFGKLCWCKRRGCAELYTSGKGIEVNHREDTGESKSLSEIYRAFLNGDTNAAHTIDTFLNYFAVTFNNIFLMFQPEVIVFGGGVSNLPILYDEGYERFLRLSGVSRSSVRFLKNELGDSSGIFGAALLPDMST